MILKNYDLFFTVLVILDLYRQDCQMVRTIKRYKITNSTNLTNYMTNNLTNEFFHSMTGGRLPGSRLPPQQQPDQVGFNLCCMKYSAGGAFSLGFQHTESSAFQVLSSTCRRRLF